MLPYSALVNPSDVARTCPNKRRSGPNLDVQQHHCYGCRYGGGVDRRHTAVARCLADVIHSRSCTTVSFEEAVPGLTRIVNGQREHARMVLVFKLNGSYLGVAISSNPALIAAASARPGHMAKRAEKSKFDRYPHINPAPCILETTSRPVYHAKKFISNLMKDAGNPSLALRESWSAIQSVLHSAISKRQLSATATCRLAQSFLGLCDHYPTFLQLHGHWCDYRLCGNTHCASLLACLMLVPPFREASPSAAQQYRPGGK